MPTLRSARILHLEDDPRDAELIHDLLQSGGVICSIDCVKNAQEFHAALGERFDLCLLDYGITGYGGQAAFRAIRQRQPYIPVIVVSGILGEEAAVEWLQLGVTDYVLKQRPARLVAAVHRALTEAEESHRRREIEAELRQAQAVARLGTWTFDVEEGRFRCSEETYRIFGIIPEKPLIIEDFLACVHPDDRESVSLCWNSAVDLGRNYDLTYRILVGGGEKWIHERAEAKREDTGRIVRVTGMSQDITERERAKSAIVASEHFVNTTLSALTDLIIVLDGEGRILKKNRAWEEFDPGNELRAAARRAHGENYLGICDHMASAGANYAGRIAALVRELIGTPSSEGFEHVFQLQQPERWFLCRGTRFTHEGAQRLIITYTDISARRRAEEALRRLNVNLEAAVAARTADLESANARLANKEQEIRTVLDNLLACVISIDERGVIQSANPAVQTILGHSVTDVIGRNVSMLMPEPQRAQHDGYVAHYLRTGEARIIGIGREVVGLHKDGTRIALDLSISEYFVGGKRFFTGILRDNREHKKILEDLELARDQAVRASRAKSEFLAVMSHEIRTPMNGVIGMLDVLHLSSLKQEQHEMMDVIRESAYSLLHVINEILDYSKIEAGRLDIEQTAVPVEEVVEGVCAMLDRVAMKAHVELTLFIDPLIPREILGDASRLRQVLVNLVGNAVKFSGGPARRGRVSVCATLAGPDATPLLEIQVTDNGIGMNEATLAELFTPFTQADLSTTRRFGGTGLGLAISRQLVTLMGGTISVESRPDVGSKFAVRLPCVAMGDALTNVEANSLVAGLSCLVVGGPDSLADHLDTYLTHAGASVVRADDPGGAMEYLDRPLPGFLAIIRDAGEEQGSAETLLQMIGARANPSGEVAAVLIERGQQRLPRRVGAHLIALDGNVLKRRNFLNAVAMLAGRLPDASGDADSNADQQADSPSREELRRRGCLILVAEDNEINQQVILAQLHVLGFIADVAHDGRDALQRWSSGHYGLLFTDLHMPDMDGYQLTRAIRAAESADRRAPIIALTANAIKGEAERCRDVGMDEYLTKPVPLAALKSVLQRWLPPAATPLFAGACIAAPAASQVEISAPVDLTVLKELMGDDEVAVQEVLKQFSARSAGVVAEVRAACSTGNVEAATAAAHKLKSSSRAIGAIALSDVCGHIERIGRSGDPVTLSQKLPDFDRSLSAVAAFLDSL
jgi:PAS domain S-box-containing protein